MTRSMVLEEALAERAEALPVPVLAPELVAARGRREQRRRRIAGGAGALAAAAVVGIVVSPHVGVPRGVEPAQTATTSTASPRDALHAWVQPLPVGPAMNVTAWPRVTGGGDQPVVVHLDRGEVVLPQGVVAIDQPRSIPGGWLFRGLEQGMNDYRPPTKVIHVDAATRTARVVAQSALVHDLIVDAAGARFAYSSSKGGEAPATFHVVSLATKAAKDFPLPVSGYAATWDGSDILFDSGQGDYAVLDIDAGSWRDVKLRADTGGGTAPTHSYPLHAYDAPPSTLLVEAQVADKPCLVAVQDAGATQKVVVCTARAAEDGAYPKRVAPGGRWMLAAGADGTTVIDLRTLREVTGLPPAIKAVPPGDAWWETRDAFMSMSDPTDGTADLAFRWDMLAKRGERFDGFVPTIIGEAVNDRFPLAVPND